MTRASKIILIGVFFSICFVFSGFAEPQKTMSVQVKEGQLRSTPSFLGKIIANPSYGDRVEIIQDQGTWKKVAVGGLQGWMHATALTTKTIVLQGRGAERPDKRHGRRTRPCRKGVQRRSRKAVQESQS